MRLKKRIVWLLAVALLLCGCSDSTRLREEQREKQMKGIRIVYEICDEEFTEEVIEDCMYRIQKRLDDSGYVEAGVYRKGDNRIKVEIPGVVEMNAELEKLGDRGEIYFILGKDNVEMIMDEETGIYQYVISRPWEEIEASGDVIMDGSDIQGAEADCYSEDGMNQYVVTVRFNVSGREKFAETTSKYVGEAIAIIYDGEIVSVPIVQQPLTEGVAQISGSFTAEEAENIATSLRVGILPLELREISCKVIEME